VKRKTAIRLSYRRRRAAAGLQFEHRAAKWFAGRVMQFSFPGGVSADAWLLGEERLGETHPHK